ncbi:hypothetical protein PULV_b0504 [Pseudoalteromonas ulvae UL12]|nr:hypothetical protein [Pseudoalteromonas ulvae UL12]
MNSSDNIELPLLAVFIVLFEAISANLFDLIQAVILINAG